MGSTVAVLAMFDPISSVKRLGLFPGAQHHTVRFLPSTNLHLQQSMFALICKRLCKCSTDV